MTEIDMTAQLGWLITATQVALLVSLGALLAGPWVGRVRAPRAAGGREARGRVAPPPPPRRVEWRRGVRALRELLDHPQQTEKAFEIFFALDGGSEERAFQKFLAQPDGPRLIAERPALIAVLADPAALRAMPDGSLGRAYLDFLHRTRLDPAGLVALRVRLETQAREAGEDLPVLDPAREWFRERTIVLHDLWHVLTGYGVDEMGEAALLAFSLAQVGGRANALLVAGVALRAAMAAPPGFLRYLFQAWRRGRRAGWLVALPYEELLSEPLDTVRRTAAIAPARVAHPGGIRRGSFPGSLRAAAA